MFFAALGPMKNYELFLKVRVANYKLLIAADSYLCPRRIGFLDLLDDLHANFPTQMPLGDFPCRRIDKKSLSRIREVNQFDLAPCIVQPQIPLIKRPHVIIDTEHLISICQIKWCLGCAYDRNVAELSCISCADDSLDILIEPDNFDASRILQLVISQIITLILLVHVSLVATVVVVCIVVVIVVIFYSFNFDCIAVAVVLFLLKSPFLHFDWAEEHLRDSILQDN